MSASDKGSAPKRKRVAKAKIPRNQLLAAAQEKGHEWCVLPPQEGYPIPLIGSRLMQFKPEFPPDEHGEKWIQVLFGAQAVLQRLADQLNKQKEEFPELYENNAASISVEAVVGKLSILPKLED